MRALKWHQSLVWLGPIIVEDIVRIKIGTPKKLNYFETMLLPILIING
jgi:hypothetical protein